jgi:hypothetical protein
MTKPKVKDYAKLSTCIYFKDTTSKTAENIEYVVWLYNIFDKGRRKQVDSRAADVLYFFTVFHMLMRVCILRQCRIKISR